MKNQITNRKKWLLSGVLIGLAFSATIAQAANFSVEMEVTPDGTELAISNDQSGDQQCSRSLNPPPVKGCMFVKDKAFYRTAHITFNLESETACGVAGEGIWKLREVYLGGKDNPIAPTSLAEMGGLDSEVQVDFDVADAGTGLLSPKKITTSGGGSVKITNQNKSRQGYYIWYKVVARCMNGDVDLGTSIMADPRIINEGDPS
jgi:hypothetical protein